MKYLEKRKKKENLIFIMGSIHSVVNLHLWAWFTQRSGERSFQWVQQHQKVVTGLRWRDMGPMSTTPTRFHNPAALFHWSQHPHPLTAEFDPFILWVWFVLWHISPVYSSEWKTRRTEELCHMTNTGPSKRISRAVKNKKNQ